jgi:hypothetical protein
VLLLAIAHLLLLLSYYMIGEQSKIFECQGYRVITSILEKSFCRQRARKFKKGKTIGALKDSVFSLGAAILL